MKVGLFAHLASLLGHASHLLAYLLALLHLGQNDVCYVGVFVQEIVHLLLDKVADEFVYADATFRSCGERTQFYLRLAFKHRFLDIDADGSYDTISDVTVFKVFARVILDNLGNVLLEHRLMSTTQSSVLTIDEGIILLAILLGMREGYLYVLSLEMADGVEGIVVHAVVEQVG